MPYLNVVFQGGGVRGIAYAGVLASKPADVRIHAAGGTSAGSIVAGLIAVGCQASEIKSILEKDELRSLIEKAEVERMERFQRAWRDLQSIWVTKKGKREISLLRAFWFARSHSHIIEDVKQVWQQKGLHRSRKLRNFLDDIFGNKTFADIQIEDLKIVAADVNQQKYRIYSKAQNLTTPIAEAVHASVSIPIFFEPFLSGTNHFVDGGMLSNFPSFLFALGYYPTMGFRLIDFVAPIEIDSTPSYLKALLLTMTDAHDKERGNPPHFISYEIPTDIPATKFALSKDDVNKLYRWGKEVGERVNWSGHASDKRVVQYYDPKPDETLQFSLGQAHTLFSEYSKLYVDRLVQETTFSVYIENDWSTRYVSRNTLRVEGNKQLFFTRFKAIGTPTSIGGPLSLIDFKVFAQELYEGGQSKDLIRIPAYNGEDEKGFLLFFSPPISADKSRTILTQFEIEKEFANTLEKDKPATVSYTTPRRAQDHEVKLTFEIFVDQGLPDLRFDSQFDQNVQETGLVEGRSKKQAYRRFAVSVPNTKIEGTRTFKVGIERTTPSGARPFRPSAHPQ
jgi:predicted acylesterase/phospholipase RssA